ncbi:MAG: carboxypeptidase regulatory-like domain-containing protein [Rhodopirellula sp.]|nr:carboxypeptidase regulatory-like domain-containing protein [Rhodopirellula sp.]
MSKATAARGLILGFLALLLIGCGGSGGDLPPLQPVSGTVILDGQPLKGAAVEFVPIGTTSGTGASASTGPDGKFALKCQGRDGAPAGEYRVVISKEVMPDGSDPPPDVMPAESGAQQMLPPEYSDYEQTTIKKTVAEGGGTIDIELTTK